MAVPILWPESVAAQTSRAESDTISAIPRAIYPSRPTVPYMVDLKSATANRSTCVRSDHIVSYSSEYSQGVACIAHYYICMPPIITYLVKRHNIDPGTSRIPIKYSIWPIYKSSAVPHLRWRGAPSLTAVMVGIYSRDFVTLG